MKKLLRVLKAIGRFFWILAESKTRMAHPLLFRNSLRRPLNW